MLVSGSIIYFLAYAIEWNLNMFAECDTLFVNFHFNLQSQFTEVLLYHLTIIYDKLG